MWNRINDCSAVDIEFYFVQFQIHEFTDIDIYLETCTLDGKYALTIPKVAAENCFFFHLFFFYVLITQEEWAALKNAQVRRCLFQRPEQT